MSMPIETQLSVDNLNVLSDFYLKMKEQHNEIENYTINYKRTNNVSFILSSQVQQTADYNKFTSPYYMCIFSLKNENTNENYTSATFDFTTNMANCTIEQSGSYDIPLTYNSTSSVYKYYASNKYSENYLDYETYKTITIQPSPSPEPEEPTESGFDSINPYFWILPSFLLMLIFMYKFIDKIFARGE